MKSMNNFFQLIIFTAVFLFTFSSISNELNGYKENNDFKSLFNLSSKDTEWVNAKIESMTLIEKCAQLIIPNISSGNVDEDTEEFKRLGNLAKELKVGGLIFFKGDIMRQATLTNYLQENSDIPLLIASDFERGLGMRLQDAVEFPYNMAIGAANDPNLTYLVGKVTAIEGRGIGVHQNYAPLIDINYDYRNPIINVRAYSDDPNIISWHAAEYIRGMHDGGMLTTAKHFPGHGSTDLDSHSELPVIFKSREEIEMTDLLPFIHLIKLGVKSIMIGHLEVPAYEGKRGLPATLSHMIVTDLLQNQLGFQGLIVTDAMNMHAITKNYSSGEAAKLAVQAGNDLIIFPADAKEAIEGIYHAVQNNEISVERLNQSVYKILSAKKWLRLDESKLIDLKSIKNILNNKSHKRLAEEVAEKSITLVKNDKFILPLRPDKYYYTACISINNRKSENKEPYTFEKLIQEELNYTKTDLINLRSTKKDFDRVKKMAKKADLILLPIYITVRSFQGTIEMDSNHVQFIKEILALNKPTIMMSFGSPYILSDFPEATTYLNAYGAIEVSQKAMLNAILGNTDISGSLPVSLPSTNYQIGFGLKLKSDLYYFQEEAVDSNYEFQKVDSLMAGAVADSVFPGGVLLIGHRNRVIYEKAFGHHTYNIDSQEITTQSIFDLASVTKVVGTTSAAMMLWDSGLLDLDEKVIHYLPEFNNNNKDEITIRNLLLHTSGLPAWKPFYKDYSKAGQVINAIMNSELEFEPGEKYLYSDLGMITLQKVIEKLTNTPINKFLEKKLFIPLNMNRTMYNPPPDLWYYTVPTEIDDYWRMTTLKGKVHDETAYLLGGVAGHAGLFSTASDLARFMAVLVSDGKQKGKQYFNAETIEKWTSKQSNLSSRGLGWDTKSEGYSSAGKKFSMNSFGHTGFTGTSIWVDKERKLFVILLTNRVHPKRENRKIIDFRPVLHDAIIDAVSFL